jgi:DNA-binding NarL/FixJ family response regulator
MGIESMRSVLLVDDNQIFLETLARFLAQRSEGDVAVVGAAQGGRDALAYARRLRPELVLLDLAMPDLSGLAVLPKLRETLPAAILIALTLQDSDEIREAALAAGADAFVSKASLERDLLPTIREFAARCS